MTLTLHHGDCLELMKNLPDKSVDLFLCDLPYGCLTGGAGKEKAKRNAEGNGGVMGCKWDIPIDLSAFWVQVKRLCKDDHTPVLMFCSAKFGYELINSNPTWFRYDLVWNKMRGVSFLQANKSPMRSHEMIYVFAKKGAKYTRVDVEGEPYFKKSKGHTNEQYGVQRVEGNNKGTRCVLSVVDCFNKAGHIKGTHPTQKPDDLYEWLITRYSKEGDTILDPTAGSFASCFTAQRLGRNAIGIEMDDGFFNKAKNLTEK
jgi:site-specific DNA-methyltransferase (adenine-specific)